MPSSETTSVEDFYPRPPRGGRRLLWCFLCNFAKFLSTPSARRATFRLRKYNTSITISIHALREEGDAGKVKVTL